MHLHAAGAGERVDEYAPGLPLPGMPRCPKVLGQQPVLEFGYPRADAKPCRRAFDHQVWARIRMNFDDDLLRKPLTQ